MIFSLCGYVCHFLLDWLFWTWTCLTCPERSQVRKHKTSHTQPRPSGLLTYRQSLQVFCEVSSPYLPSTPPCPNTGEMLGGGGSTITRKTPGFTLFIKGAPEIGHQLALWYYLKLYFEDWTSGGTIMEGVISAACSPCHI